MLTPGVGSCLPSRQRARDRGEGASYLCTASSGLVLPDSGGPKCRVLGAIVTSRWAHRKPPREVPLEVSHPATRNVLLERIRLLLLPEKLCDCKRAGLFYFSKRIPHPVNFHFKLRSASNLKTLHLQTCGSKREPLLLPWDPARVQGPGGGKPESPNTVPPSP